VASPGREIQCGVKRSRSVWADASDVQQRLGARCRHSGDGSEVAKEGARGHGRDSRHCGQNGLCSFLYGAVSRALRVRWAVDARGAARTGGNGVEPHCRVTPVFGSDEAHASGDSGDADSTDRLGRDRSVVEVCALD
jgi:hypothetical protein